MRAEVPIPRLKSLIVTCGIDFQLSGVERERLLGAGAPPPILEILANKDVQRRVELEFWTSAKESAGTALIEEYLKRWGQGEFAPQAKELLNLRRALPLRANIPKSLAAKDWNKAFLQSRQLLELIPADEEATKWLDLATRKLALAESSKRLHDEMAGETLEFVPLPTITFVMGGERNADERPKHSIRLTKSIEMSKTEVTQKAWRWLMGTNPSQVVDPRKPVEMISWFDTQAFIQKLNDRNDGFVYRLPTEAEWEAAARAGSGDETADALDSVAWYLLNSGRVTHQVAQKQPNAFGLFDMLGNVWEWCQDWYAADYYQRTPILDPTGPETGKEKVVRGGDRANPESMLRPGQRFKMGPSFKSAVIGFRLVRTPIE